MVFEQNERIIFMNSNSSIKVSQPSITVEPRDVVLSVFLTFITLGIYGLYWQYKLTNEIHALSGKPQTASGGKAVFYTVLSFTIYGYYWLYKIGKEISLLRKEKGLPPDSVLNETYAKAIIIISCLSFALSVVSHTFNYLASVAEITFDSPTASDEVLFFTFFTFAFLVGSFFLHVLVAFALIFYVNKRTTDDPSTLYVFLAFFRMQVFTLAFPQLVLNDYLRNMPKESCSEALE